MVGSCDDHMAHLSTTIHHVMILKVLHLSGRFDITREGMDAAGHLSLPSLRSLQLMTCEFPILGVDGPPTTLRKRAMSASGITLPSREMAAPVGSKHIIRSGSMYGLLRRLALSLPSLENLEVGKCTGLTAKQLRWVALGIGFPKLR